MWVAALALAADTRWYADADGDGYGAPWTYTIAPADAGPAGWSLLGNDCDDADPARHPGAAETCDGVDEDCDGSVDSAALCGVGMFQWAGHGYQLITTPATWEDARDDCLARGYHLVVVSSADEDDELDAQVDAVSSLKWWIGFHDRDYEGQWVWDDGSAGAYTNWYAGEPNDGQDGPSGAAEDCALLNRFRPSRGWNDEPCTDLDRYVCESGALQDLWADADGDGFGDPAGHTALSSDVLEGYAGNALDCDDGDATVNPGVLETWYDGVDGDCDGHSDWDADFDGHEVLTHGGGDCDDEDSSVHPGAPDPWYDGVDGDCGGGSDHDQDGDGHDAPSGGGEDCDDTDPARHPGAEEAPGDGVDQDCDGADDPPSGDTAGPDTATTDDPGEADGRDDTPDDAPKPDPGCGGCTSAGAPGGLVGLVGLLALLVRGRRVGGGPRLRSPGRTRIEPTPR